MYFAMQTAICTCVPHDRKTLIRALPQLLPQRLWAGLPNGYLSLRSGWKGVLAMRFSIIPTRARKYIRPACSDRVEVIFSARAYVSLLSEVLSRIETETGGVFLGYYQDGVWQVVESIDPGPLSRFEVAYFEYDQDYINHLINKVSRIYEKQLDLIGLWHRHPGSFDQFSATDDGTNTSYAQLSECGAISALVNIDPDFRLTIYHVASEPLRYREVRYCVLDPMEDLIQAPYASARISQINSAVSDKAETASSKSSHRIATCDEVCAALRGFLERREMTGMLNRAMGTIDNWDEDDFNLILTAIDPDAKYFVRQGFELVAHVNDDRRLELLLKDSTAATCSLLEAIWPLQDGNIVFSVNGQTYQFHPNLLGKAVEEAG